MSKLITCKSCEKEVSTDAKTCPHCGAKLKMGFLKRFVIGLIILIVGAAIFGSDDDDGAVVAGGGSGSTGPSIISINENVESDNISTSIRSLDIRKSFSDSMGIFEVNAQNGATLVAVIVDQTNTGNKPASAFDVPDLTLISPDGIEYEQDLGKSSIYAGIKDIDQKVFSDIAPGLRSQNAFVFEVADQQLNQGGWVLKVGNIRNAMFKVN